MAKATSRVIADRKRDRAEAPAITRRPALHRYAGPVGALLLAVVAYANSLGDGFAYDDETILLQNPAVLEPFQGRPVPWYEAWRRPYWPDTNARSGQDVLYRPFTVQTFAWDMRFLGPNPRWFHLVNVVLHALVALGAWWLGRRLCGSDIAGLVAGWIFAVHPMHTEAVTSIVGRAEVLATGGIVGAVLALDRMMRAERRGACLAWGVAGVLAAAIAMCSKESGVAVVPVGAAFAWWQWRAGGRRKGVALRAAFVVAAMLVVFGAYLAMRYDVCGGRLWVTAQVGGEGNVLRETSGLPRVLTPVSLVGRYVGLMAWPGRLLADYSYAAVTPTRSPLEPYFLLGLATLALLIVAAARSLRRDGGAFVAVVGWLSSYVFVSNGVILIAVIMAERWFYGPSLWITVLGVMGGQYLLARYVRAERANRLAGAAWPRVLLAAAVVALGVRTWVRNADWRDTVTLFEHDLRATAPSHRSAFVASALAADRLEKGQIDEAGQLAREAAATYPESARIQCILAEVLLAANRPAEALRVAGEAQRILPSDPRVMALLDRARSAAEGVDLNADLRRAEERLRRNPNDAEAHAAAAAALEQLGQYAPAAEHYERAARLDSGNRVAWLGWGRVLAALNRSDEAVRVYEQILARWPDTWEAHANLALQLMDKLRGKLYQPERAVEHAERAVQLGPAEMRTQLTMNLAEVCANCGQSARAITLFEQVLRHLPPNDPQRRRLSERIEFLRKEG
jgi:tetratricopeptide (TPR) repeat protein